MSQAIIILYDIHSKASFEEAKEWIKSVSSQVVGKKTEIFLIGNAKKGGRVISEGEARKYAKDCGAHYYEVSAKESAGTKRLLTRITYYVMGKPMEENNAEVIREEIHCVRCSLL